MLNKLNKRVYIWQFLLVFLFIINVMDSSYANIVNNGAGSQQKVNQQRVNIFYFSDYHGNVHAYRRLKDVSDSFDKKHPNTENFKLSGGDLVSDVDPQKRLLVFRLLKMMNLDASAVGNHEWDGGTDFYKDTEKLFQKAPFMLFNNFLSCNIKPKKQEEEKEYEKESLFQSKIITKGGNKYGLIGATTPDYRYEGCKNDDLLKVGEDISKEVKKLKEQDPSLNRFIFLSHLGKEADKVIAQSVSDIDVIIGGHSHDTIEGIIKGQNLFMSPKNEPVLIVQAGNEKTFGELSLEFDKDGKIDLSQGHEPVNITGDINNSQDSPSVKALENDILGKDFNLGVLGQDMKTKGRAEENPLGSLLCDSIRWKTGADVALSNAGTFRSYLTSGNLNNRDLEYCLPFQNEVVTIKCTGKDLAEIIKYGIESTKKEHVDPGLFQISGLKYSVTPDKKLVNLYTVDKNGNKETEIIDSQGNFTTAGADKEFKTAVNDHIIKKMFPKLQLSRKYFHKDDDKIEVNKKRVLEFYDKDRNILKEYLKTQFTDQNKPIEIEPGRIDLQTNNQVSGFGFAALINKFRLN